MAYNPADFELVEAPAGSASPYNPADFELVDDGQTGLLEGVGNALERGWSLSLMAREMEKPMPDPQAVAALQQRMQAVPPSPEYMATMNDELEPVESWNAFKSAPVKVLAELMGESLSAFAGQMIDKAPNRVAIGLGAGAAMGAPVAGIGAVPGGFIGAGAGFAESAGAASYALEMAGGVLESLESAGVPLNDPQALSVALQDPQRMQVAREFAQRKAVPVAVFDGASAVIGGRMFGGGKVASAMTRLGQGLAETFTQGAMGAAGEASGQLAQRGQITSGRSILAEGVAELPTGLIEIGAGQLSQAGANAGAPAATATAQPAPAAAPQPAPFTPPPAAETVVVEEVFGDATTAAAPAAEPAINPDDFEVVEMPGETIVTEPPAAAKTPEPQEQAPVGQSLREKFAAIDAQETAQEQKPIAQPEMAASNADARFTEFQKALDESPSRQDPNVYVPGKAAWQVVRSEWVGLQPPNYQERAALGHEQVVKQAVRDGKPVSPEVLRDYPDIAPPAQQPAAQPAAATVRQPKAPKDPATMTASQINKELDAISEKQGNLTTEFIEAGRGNETPSEYLKKDDPLAARARELFSRASDLRSEVRMRAGPDMSRLPSGRGFGPRVAAESSPAQRSRRRIKNMTAQSGAIDLSIVEDLFEYGKTIYRAGMSFGKWAGQMVKEFGQGIASFLKQVFDRIVQAYKDSPYSDTTGAVGDVRPKAKPRQFEQKAAQAPGLSEETRAQMGNDPYVPITLRGVAEDAKAWLGENGVEAAERRILELNSDEVTPSPLDFAIGLELTANLSATGQHTRAAAIVRTMSRRATSLGQTISTLAMLSRLTPEGIIFYANQTIEQYIGSLPPERQQQIRTAQDGIRQLETDIATTRKRTAEDAIIKGEQGGEKIQDKLKRRIPDKGQKQQTNVSIRSVLTSQATKAEATKQITQILVDSGISQSEATALATAITNRFYKVLEDARKAAVANRRPASGKGRVTFDKLMAQLKDGKISDQDFIGALAQLVNVPALTPELRTRLERLTREYKAATDDDIALVTAARIFEEVHGLVPADFWVKLRAVSYLSMLFAPKTWIRNLGGNQIQWLTDIGIDGAISMVFDPVASVFTGKRTTAGVYVGTRIKALLTPVQDVIKGYKWNAQQNPSANFMENLKAGVEHLRVLAKLTTQNKFDIVDAKEVGRRIFSNKFMQMWEGALSIALGGGDRAFWMSGFRASLARREAAAKKNGEWTGQPTPEDVEAAYADAMYAIYQNPNVISKNANKIRQALNRLSTFGKTDQFGLGTGLLAFTQVPGSLSLRGIIELSPLGLVSGLYEAMRPVLFKVSGARAGGQFRQEDFNKAMARAMVGSGMFYAGGYWLYSMGIITASREEDDDLEAMRRATGMGAYRINVTALKRMLGSGNFFERQTTQETDFIVPYDWAQPVAITFAAGAELAKQVEENNREGVKKGLAGKAGMAAISLAAGAKSLEELPLLSGLSSFMRTWGYSGPLDAVVNTVAGMPSMFVPQLVRQANQLMDNTVRETRSGDGIFRSFNQIAANTPGVSDQFPPRFDIMGQAIERYQYGGNSLFNVLISPAMATRVRTNPALNEAARLMDATGETRQIPRQVKRSANINGESIQLSNEQISAYQYYLGNYTMSMMNWRMASPRYARLPDTEKVRIFAQDIEDVDAAVKSALFGHDIRRLTRRQRSMRNNLVNSPLGQSMPPR
jgi:hypothetical protein